MKARLVFTFFAIIVVAISACMKEAGHVPFYTGGGTPADVSDPQVTNMPGTVKISYNLPKDSDVLYVKASYEIRKGVGMETKASYYNNYMVLQGFSDSTTRKVKLTVVSKSNKESKGFELTVAPLTPPYIKVHRMLTANVAYGGIDIHFQNPDTTDISIVTYSTDTSNIYRPIKTYYTKEASNTIRLRGLDTTLRKFSIFVKDKFGNSSDSTIVYLAPLPEKMLDKALFKEFVLPTDIASEDNWGDMGVHKIWDGSIEGWDMWHSKPGSFPMWMTFDMGVTVPISRITMWPRQDGTEYMFAQNNVKRFEIWGSSNPNPSGEWDDSWKLLVAHEVIKPSGLPLGTVSQADIDACKRGEEMTLTGNPVPVRYIRIKVLETWQDGGYAANIAEISLWQQY